MVDRLIDPVPGWWVGAALLLGIHPDSLLPESQAFEHLFDDVPLVNEGHNSHFLLAGGADHGISLPDFLDEVPPFLGRNTAGLVFGHVDDLHALVYFFGLFFLLGAFLALAAHLIGIPSIIAHELKALIRDVLGDGGDKITGGEELKIPVDLRIHPGAVDDRAFAVDGVGRLELHLFRRERVADDIPCDALQVLAFVGLNAAAAVYVEAGMLPLLEHAGAFGGQEALFAEEGDEPGAEEFLDRIHAVVGEDQETFVAQKQSVGHEQVEMRVEVEVLVPQSRDVNGHDDAGHSLRLVQLLAYHGNWYLLAHNEEKDRMATFALSRFREVEGTGAGFRRAPEFDARAYAREAFGITRGEKLMRVRLLFEPKLAVYLMERDWHPSQTFTQRPDGRVEMCMATSGRQELIRWVLSWMPDVRVLAPKSLKDRIEEKLRDGLTRQSGVEEVQPAAPADKPLSRDDPLACASGSVAIE